MESHPIAVVIENDGKRGKYPDDFEKFSAHIVTTHAIQQSKLTEGSHSLELIHFATE